MSDGTTVTITKQDLMIEQLPKIAADAPTLDDFVTGLKALAHNVHAPIVIKDATENRVICIKPDGVITAKIGDDATIDVVDINQAHATFEIIDSVWKMHRGELQVDTITIDVDEPVLV